MTLLSGTPTDATGYLSDTAALAIGVEHRLELTRRDLANPVSGLPNRAALLDRMREAVAQRGRLDAVLADCGLTPRAGSLAVVCLDLDHFQGVGSALGLDGGDAALRAVAQRIGVNAHDGDTLAQIGDDEFVVACSHLRDPEDAERFAESLVAGLRRPVVLADGRSVTITASAGVAVHSDSDTDTPETLLAQAAAALSTAKDLGRNRAMAFTPGAIDASDAFALRLAVEGALDRDELVAWFQPIVEIPSGATVGFETLVRWEHPDRGVLSPAAFLDAIREAGLGVRLGEVMLRAACRFARSLVDAHAGDAGDVYVTVNIDNEHLCSRGFVDGIAAALAATGLDGRHLVLELVESDRIDPDGDGAAVLDAVRALGVGLAIDDFGTGYSSLGYLQRLPVQMLKLDGTFVGRIAENPGDRAIVGLVIEAAAVLGVAVTAECVEDDDQMAVLAELGCTRAQGYRFSRPLNSEAALDLWSAR